MGSSFLVPYVELICSGECLGLRHYDLIHLIQGTKGLEKNLLCKVSSLDDRYTGPPRGNTKELDYNVLRDMEGVVIYLSVSTL